MSADPGLTDLIAAHQWIHFAPRRNSKCACGWQGDDPDYPGVGHPAHVALVVEQHTNGRTAELEARVDEWSAEYRKGVQSRDDWRARAEKAEATIARVKALVQDEDGDWLPYWRATTSEIRAALEGAGE